MNDIRYKRPDKKNALSIIEAARREMKYALSIEISDKSASTIIRNIYECFRMLGDALLVSKGIKSEDHVASIKALLKLNVPTPRPLAILDNYRILRHNLNYYGYIPNVKEAEDILGFAKGCFEPTVQAVLKEVSK